MIIIGPTAPVVSSIIGNMISLFNTVIKRAPHENTGMHHEDNSWRYYSGSPFAIFNGEFSGDHFEKSPHAHFADMANFFAEKQMPFTWWWLHQAPIPKDILLELHKFGFQSLGTYYGVAADLKSVCQVQSPRHKIKIKEVTTEYDYQHFMYIIRKVLQLAGNISSDYAAMFKSFGPQGTFKHYLGFYDNEPASTLTTYTIDDTVGFYNAATLPHAQQKGVCTALVLHAAHSALEEGCEVAISQLMAPGMAKGLSMKLGAKTYCRMLPFVTKSEKRH